MVTLQIVVTENCNLGCSYCYMKNRNTFLTRETFMSFYESLPFDQEYIIDFFGGEPLLNFDMVKFIIETVSTDQRFKSFFIPSNGLLLTQDIVNFLKENNVKFSWSCDGIVEENIDGYINKVGLIDQLCDTVTVMVSEHNISMIDNHKFFSENFGIVPNYKVVREGWTDTSSKMFKNMYNEYVNWLVVEFKEKRIDLPKNIIIDINSLFAATKSDDEMLKCIDTQRVCLMPNGETGFCARMCTDNDLSNPDGSGLYDKCESCEIGLVCEQGCYHIVKGVGVDDYLCVVYKTMIEEAIKLNHKLRDDMVWNTRYIRRIFDDTRRTV